MSVGFLKVFGRSRRLGFPRRFSTASLPKELTERHVVPTYARYDITLSHGKGMYVWDMSGKKYLDMGGGIAVNTLGHAHPALVGAIHEQSQKLMHTSNLYFTEPQAQLAQRLTNLMGGGKAFFCNSGAEANEGMFKLARKFGNDTESGPRTEIITTINSFHGRTLAGLSATGQEKIKKGFHPMVEGFKHVAYNDLAAMEAAIGLNTCAIMIEGIQGEGGIMPASPEYLLGLRKLCDENNLLLLFDAVQCGHFRSGAFQSYQRILEGTKGGEAFEPDAISMAKALGGGFPIGAVWITEQHSDILSPGYHGTTFGGNPLACAAALAVLREVKGNKLEENARNIGNFLHTSLTELAVSFPRVIKSVRGLGLMMGVEIAETAFSNKDKSASSQFVAVLHDHGILTVPSGEWIVRLLPPLNITQGEAEEFILVLEGLCEQLTKEADDTDKV